MNKRKRVPRDPGLRPYLTASALLSIFLVALTLLSLRHAYPHFQLGSQPQRRHLIFVLSMPIIISGSISTLINLFFERHISVLTQGLRAVAGGDFQTRITPRRGCPIRDAYDSFNKMAAELGSVQTLREDFINNFSHEFKTPIAAIQGFAELLQEPGVTEAERQEYLSVISQEAGRLSQLSSSALLMSKLEAQQYIPEKTEFALDEQIKRCAILLLGAWESKHIVFSAELAPVQYTGNEELMSHIWLNLMGNAFKYTPDGGEVEVALEETAEEIVFRVSDTGIGMPPEMVEHIFDRYYQGDPSRKEEGLGLGLSIAHRVVELCGGRIEVKTVVDQGSEFTVRLPKDPG